MSRTSTHQTIQLPLKALKEYRVYKEGQPTRAIQLQASTPALAVSDYARLGLAFPTREEIVAGCDIFEEQLVVVEEVDTVNRFTMRLDFSVHFNVTVLDGTGDAEAW